MNRTFYFNYIEEKLNLHAMRVNARGRLNVLDFNQHSENFYAHFLNLLFGWNLSNLNEIKHNVEGIDLIDNENKIFAQVSATATKQKLEHSLSKDIYKNYEGYRFKFISISKDFKLKEYDNSKQQYNIQFDAVKDIIDKNKLLEKIMSLDIVKQKEVYQLIKEELGNDIDVIKMDSNLAKIINILALEDLEKVDFQYEINSFEIERKIEFNNLTMIKDIIDDYKIYHHKLEEKYIEFDKFGKNKSFMILQLIRNEYLKISIENQEEYEVFFKVMERVKEIIINSKNYIEISYEELEFCVGIIVVDAFIRCKIFKNPEGYQYVVT